LEDNKNTKINNFSNIGYILKLLWKASPFRILATILRTITEQVFYVFFFVYLTQYIFTAIETRTKYSDLIIMITFACICHIGIHILSAWYGYYIARNDPKIYKYIFDLIISKAERIPLVRFEQPDFYDKFTRALDEAIDRGFKILDTIARLLAGVFAGFATMFLIINVDPILLLFTILPVASSLIAGKANSKLWYDMTLEKTHQNRIIGYTKRIFYEKKYAGEIRLYGIKELLFKKHRDAFNKLYDIDVKYRKKIAFYSVMNDLVFRVLMFFGSMIYIVYKVTTGNHVLIAPYIAMINAIGFMSGNIEDAIVNFIDLTKQAAFTQKLRDFLEYRDENKKLKSLVPITKPIDEIWIKNVSYTYAGSNKPVIDNISLHIHKGEKIALVGHNGAGKTTIVKLLMGLYDIESGEIIAGGNNILNYEKSEYHKHFGVVFQDFQIFSLPLAQNVLMRTPENDEDRNRVIEALQKAQFGEKLASLPEGIDSMVTKEFDEKGIGMSGGEAQKIAIARVFAKDCDIAILDEPSSALDPIAEFNMYNNMMEVAKNKTVIFISHRLSSARMADKIYMLEEGRIIEQGNHEELMNMNGKYAEMFNLQAQNYREEEAVAYE
jgi:ATP-binding cassette subfamily B protein